MEVDKLYYYPDNMTAKATLWLWELRDIAIIGISLLISVLAITQAGLMFPLVLAVVYAFLSIRFDGVSILDFIRFAVSFFLMKPQHYEWRETTEN